MPLITWVRVLRVVSLIAGVRKTQETIQRYFINKVHVIK